MFNPPKCVLFSVLVLNFIISSNVCYNHLLTLKLSAMKNLLLTLYFSLIGSFIFCQTPNTQNIQIHLKNYAHNCVPRSSINDAKKSIGNESEISPYKPFLHIATHYYKLTDYGSPCFIGQNTLHNTIEVVSSWTWLNGSIRGLGFRGGYSILTGVNGNCSLLDGQLSL